MNTVAENLNAVADMIGKGRMWCKSEWTALRELHGQYAQEGDSERVGCLEGLLAEQLGLYDGYQTIFRYGPGVQHSLGQVLNLFDAYDLEQGIDEVGNSTMIKKLRETEEWNILADLIIEEVPEFKARRVLRENTVTCFNDQEATTEHEAEMICRKAAIAAEERVK